MKQQRRWNATGRLRLQQPSLYESELKIYKEIIMRNYARTAKKEISYIPNVRNQFGEELVKDSVDEFSHRYVTKLIRNAYWQGFLNERGKLIVREYDLAVRTGDTLFDNLKYYDDQLEEALDIHMTDERRNRIANVFRDIFHDWMESERDELVVSLLESGEAFADYPEPWDEEGVPYDEAPEGYKQREDGLEGLEDFEPWAEKEADKE